MPSITVIQAKGDGTAKPLGQRHVHVLPKEGEYVTLGGSPYLVDAVIHSLDSNRILVRVRAIMSDPMPEEGPPQVIDHQPDSPQQLMPQQGMHQPPALPPAPDGVLTYDRGFDLDDEDDLYNT